MRFQGKKIVVIGGSSGMGLATAKMAASEGATVVIASRSNQKLSEAAAEIDGVLEIFSVNAMEENSIKDLFDAVGEFDHLATPGSEAVMGRFLDMDTKTARKAFNSKFWGQFHAAKYAAPKIRPGGSITFFAGIWSQRPVPGGSVISAINGGIEALARALAVELAPIRVNTVSPGIVDTPIYASMDPEQRDAMFKAVAASIPVARIGRPDDIAKAVLYLMSNEYTTGSTLYVDGGTTLR